MKMKRLFLSILAVTLIFTNLNVHSKEFKNCKEFIGFMITIGLGLYLIKAYHDKWLNSVEEPQ